MRLFVTPWTVAHQSPLSVEFGRQAYWSGLPFPSLGELSDPGIESASPVWPTNSLPLSHLGSLFTSGKKKIRTHQDASDSENLCNSFLYLEYFPPEHWRMGHSCTFFKFVPKNYLHEAHGHHM